jgi:redox-sensitive bicupin YhaK (pirin superfamily)
MFAQQILDTELRGSERAIAYRTHGRTRGPITRLASPSDLGELMKPFVFLDHAVFEAGKERIPMEILWHPHSGIATVTVVLEGTIAYAETTGKSGVLATGGVEWMRAGNGVWHTGQAGEGNVRVFQLWVALPPRLENGPPASRYATPEEIPKVGPARVILGEYLGAKSPIDSPPMTYLHVKMKAGEVWSYRPAPDHAVAWAAVSRGILKASSPVTPGELAIFEPGAQPVEVVAEGETEFVIGSARKHPHDLVLGNYSVHTSVEALHRGEQEIRRIGRQLRANGTIRA